MCLYDNFRTKSLLGKVVHHDSIYVKFIGEGNKSRFKVTRWEMLLKWSVLPRARPF